jgi:ATP-dependent DNA helicase RecG
VRHSRVFCTRWNGLDKAGGLIDAIDDEEYSGSLITLLQESLGFVRRNSKKAWRKTGDGRIEYPEYPETAVLEGIVNAIIHRDYLEIGSEVHIDMFDDRLEIYSPGGMFDGSRVQDLDLMNVPSKRRNPVLADIFNRLKYMDRRGSGFKKILTDYKNQNNFKEELKPMFNSGFGSFTLTLYNLNYGIPELNGTQEERQDGRQDRRQDGRQDGRQEEEPPKIVNVSLSEILEYCKTPRSIKEILEFCGVKSRTTFIKNHLAPLISEGKLRMTIPDKPNSKKQKYTSQDLS